MKKKIFLIILVILAALLLISRGKIVEYSTPVDTEVQIEIQKDLFEDYYEEANKIMSEMTLEEKVGQLFYARYPYNSNDEIVKENPGGYILFARDFKNETKESILQKINKNQENSKIKMFFGVDEEGGTVVRVSKYKNFRSEPFPSPQMLFEEGGFELVLSDLEEKMDLLKSIGINTNFAPVVDLPTKYVSPMIIPS